MMDEYRNVILQLLNSAKEQLSEEEYKELMIFVRNAVRVKEKQE